MHSAKSNRQRWTLTITPAAGLTIRNVWLDVDDAEASFDINGTRPNFGQITVKDDSKREFRANLRMTL